RDVRDSYVAAARKVEPSIGPLSLVPGPWSLDPDGRLVFDTKDQGPGTKDYPETFPCLERTLLRHVEESLLREPSPPLLALALSRQSRFWAEVTPQIQAHWALTAAAAEVLLEAERVAKALKEAPASVPKLVEAYTGGERPWCLLDSHHRHLE